MTLSHPKPDHWASRYVSGSFMSEQYHEPSPKRSSGSPSLGLGAPCRILKDLQGNTHLSTRPQADRPASQDYTAPIVQGSDGALSKVCGSVLDPAESRNKWACAGCKAVFARDSTLYTTPASSQPKDTSYYCRTCYAERYSLGKCVKCSRDVLGSTKDEGKYVKASAGLWHGKCWKCTRCNKSDKDGVEVLVGMDGHPCCEECFGKPKLSASPQPCPAGDHKNDEVRRVSRVDGAGTGPMGATIAELSTRLGQQRLSSPPKPLVQTGAQRKSPIKSAYAFPNHVSTSPPKSAMTRSGSLSGSPPKPRPLMAQFNDGLRLAAFRSSLSTTESGDERQLIRKDSRSRSVSPVKRTPSPPAVSDQDRLGQAPNKTQALAINAPPQTDHGRIDKTQVQSIKAEPSTLESAQGSSRCCLCHMLPFERPEATGCQEVLMVTLSDSVTLHAECFRCAICEQSIDGTGSFTRLEGHSQDAFGKESDGMPAFAHPLCTPPVRSHVVQAHLAGGDRSYRCSPDTQTSTRSHATHQRELKPSPVPPTPISFRTTSSVDDTDSKVREGGVNSAVRRFQSTTGAAPPVNSKYTTSRPNEGGAGGSSVNPAAGIFSRLSALSIASKVDLVSGSTHSGGSGAQRYGGMQACAFCGGKVSALESVLGPRNTQWHKMCLVCRGPPPSTTGKDTSGFVYSSRGKASRTTPLCGKKLDSGAKVNPNGEVRCRDCYTAESSVFRVKS